MTAEAREASRPETGPTTEPDEAGFSVRYTRGRAFRTYLTWYTIAMIAFTAVWGSILGIVLPNHVQLLELPLWFTGADAGVDVQQLTLLKQSVDAGTATATPDQQRLLGILANFDASKAQALAIIVALGAVLTMVIQPIIGVLSDRTRSRFGRRAPWILSGALIGAALLIAARYSPTLALLGLFIALAQAVLNMSLSPLAATVADRVVAEKRGIASALGGFGNFFGGLLGGILAGVFFATLGLDIYIVVALFVALASVMFVLFARDRSSLDLNVPKHNWREFFVGFTIALRDRDFRWVWIARILLTFGYTVSTALSLYLLQSYIHPALSAQQATATAPLLIFAGLPGTLIMVFIAGKLSDKLGRRKPFVIAASVLMAVSMLVPIISPTLGALFIQTALAGVAFGIYLPVDQALFIDVLPDARSAGRDLGVAALGSNLGQTLGPVIASTVVALTGGYLGIWVAAFVLVGFGAVAILPVKRVR
jgi:Na+/melibiose symporter-like transporter